MTRSLPAFVRSVVDSLFPPICPLCRRTIVKEQGSFCDACMTAFSLIIPPYCARCGIPFSDIQGHTPHRCQVCLDPSLPDIRIRSIGVFSGPIRACILKFKYQGDIVMGDSLAQLMVTRFPLFFTVPEYDCILPVPLHLDRLREREFNQSALLAKPLAQLLSLPMDLTSVQRVRNTTPQSMLGEKDRRKNVKGVYRVVRPDRIKGKHIMIVDDVCTTGATIEEIAVVLLEKGAARVDAITVARAA